MFVSVSQNLITVPLVRSSDTFGDGMPNRPAELAHRDLDPDAGEEADQTVREMKFARKPSRASRARSSRPAASSALRLARASHCDDPRLEPGDPEPGDAGEQDRRGGGVAADHEVT